MGSVDGECDDWGVSMCRTASAFSVSSVELSSQRNEFLRFKEFDTLSHEMQLNSGETANIFLVSCCLCLQLHSVIRNTCIWSFYLSVAVYTKSKEKEEIC